MVPSSILDRMNMLEQEQKVQARELQYMQKLIEESEKLHTELTEARSQITKLQLAISSDITPITKPSDNPNTNLLMTGTVESRHAPSYEEWEQFLANFYWKPDIGCDLILFDVEVFEFNSS
ncbi:hypothetical protein BDC45DRAFT_542634 [Circinella umbellata]|nr:hypothetical protein BDC45DRAFT_542634 [Circinella umbellata]